MIAQAISVATVTVKDAKFVFEIYEKVLREIKNKMIKSNKNQVAGWGQYYDRSGGYGALTDACPAVTSTGSANPGIVLRTTSN